MKSTELIKGKWYINEFSQLIKFEIHRRGKNYCSEFIDSRGKDLFRSVSLYSTSNVIREATIDDFPDEFKYLFIDTINEPIYEIY